MRIEQLLFLVEVAETGSITLAAENNYISQQSLSEAIRKLEQEFGIVLLERSHQGVQPTKVGKEFLKGAKEILEKVENLEKKFKNNKSIRISTLRGNLSIIVSIQFLNNSLLQSILNAFIKEHPNVNITIDEKDYRSTIQSVAAKKADIGILVAHEKLLNDDGPNSYLIKEVYFEKLHDGKLVMCVGKTSPLAKRKYISMKEALKYPLIVYQPEEISVNPWYVQTLTQFGEAKKLILTSSADVYKETIINGLAIGYSTTMYLKGNPHFREEIIPITISDNIIMSCGWIRPKNRDLSEAAKEFIRLWRRFDRDAK